MQKTFESSFCSSSGTLSFCVWERKIKFFRISWISYFFKSCFLVSYLTYFKLGFTPVSKSFFFDKKWSIYFYLHHLNNTNLMLHISEWGVISKGILYKSWFAIWEIRKIFWAKIEVLYMRIFALANSQDKDIDCFKKTREVCKLTMLDRKYIILYCAPNSFFKIYRERITIASAWRCMLYQTLYNSCYQYNDETESYVTTFSEPWDLVERHIHENSQ